MRRRVSPSGLCGFATVSDELADTISELDDFSFSVDVKKWSFYPISGVSLVILIILFLFWTGRL